MDSKELCRRLKISAGQLASAVKKGLPRAKVKGRWSYDAAAVAKWIAEQSAQAAAPESPSPPLEIVATSIAEAVKVCRDLMGDASLHRRTFQEWMLQEGFPGRPGPQGTHGRGYFPCRAIVQWREGRANAGQTGEEQSERALLLKIRRESEQFDLERKRGEHLPVAFVEQMFTRVVAIMANRLESLPDDIANVMPPEHAESARTLAKAQVDQVRTSIAIQCEQLANRRHGKA